MPSETRLVEARIQIDPQEEMDAEQLDGLTRELREELQESGVASAEMARGGRAPAGSKGLMMEEAIGHVTATMLVTVVMELLEHLTEWVMRKRGLARLSVSIGNQTVFLEYSPSTMSQEDMKRLVRELSDRLLGTSSEQK